MTSPELTEAETAAGVAAFTEFFDANVSSWKRSMVPPDMIAKGVAVVVAAVDAVRDSQTGETR